MRRDTLPFIFLITLLLAIFVWLLVAIIKYDPDDPAPMEAQTDTLQFDNDPRKHLVWELEADTLKLYYVTTYTIHTMLSIYRHGDTLTYNPGDTTIHRISKDLRLASPGEYGLSRWRDLPAPNDSNAYQGEAGGLQWPEPSEPIWTVKKPIKEECGK